LKEVDEHGSRFVLTHVDEDVRVELDRYGVTAAIGEDAYFDTLEDLLAAYRSSRPTSG
jgi:hypothetical protein